MVLLRNPFIFEEIYTYALLLDCSNTFSGCFLFRG